MDIDPALVPSYMEDLNVFRYTAVAAFTFFIHDWVMVLDEEVRLLWNARMSFVKALYILIRLTTCATVTVNVYMLLGVYESDTCKSVFYAAFELAIIVFMLCEVMLFMRVYAIWQTNKVLVSLSGGVLLITFGVVFSVAELDAKIVVAGSDPDIFGRGCLLGDAKGSFWIFHFALLVNETIMLILTLIKAYSATKNEKGHILSKGFRVIAYDGIAYFALMAFLSVISVLTVRFNPINLRLIFAVMHATIQSVFCARLLLRLRGAFSEDPDSSTTISTFVGRDGSSDSNVCQLNGIGVTFARYAQTESGYSSDDFPMEEIGISQSSSRTLPI